MNNLEKATFTEARDALLEAKSWIEECYLADKNISAAELVDGENRRMHQIIGAINRTNAILEALGEKV